METESPPLLSLPASPLFSVAHSSPRSLLIRGESEDVLPQLPAGFADCLIADPPYCSGGMLPATRMTATVEAKYCHSGVQVERPTFSGDSRDQHAFFAWSTLWLRLCRRAVRVGGYVLIFVDWRQVPTMSDALQAAGWTWRGLLAWDKGRGSRAPHKGYFRHQCEFIVWGTNGPCAIADEIGPLDGCFRVPVTRTDKHHTTGKPTALMAELVARIPAGGIVLDNFAGSSSTGVAALLNGRRFVGVELSDEYAAIGADRLRAAERGELLKAA